MESNLLQLLKNIGESFFKEGQKIYIVGEAVRDDFLNKQTKNYELLTTANTDTLLKVISSLATLHLTKEVINNTAQFNLNGHNFIIKSSPKIFSKNDLYTELGTNQFTINSIARSLSPEDFWELIDPYNGIKDIENKIIKTVFDPEFVFKENPNLIISCIKYSIILDFTIEEKTFNAIKKLQPHINIQNLDKKILRNELLEILSQNTPSKGIITFLNTGWLFKILPELELLKQYPEEENKNFKDTFSHTLKVIDNCAMLYPNNGLFVLSALLHDIGKTECVRVNDKKKLVFYNHENVGFKISYGICKRIGLNYEERKYITNLIKNHMRLHQYDESWTDSAVRRIIRQMGNYYEDLILLSKADITGTNIKKAFLRKKKIENFQKRAEELIKKDKEKESLTLPVDGNDIMNILHIIPTKKGGGPLVGIILNNK